jgi:hypothetical protein
MSSDTKHFLNEINIAGAEVVEVTTITINGFKVINYNRIHLGHYFSSKMRPKDFLLDSNR